MFNAFLSIMRYEILIYFRQAYTWVTPLCFFVMVVCLFPLALGADISILNKTAPAIIWIAALLAVLLSLANIFRDDVEEGYLELMLLSQHSMVLLVLCKTLSHWLCTCLPLIIISPLLGLLLNLNAHVEFVLIASLLLGTPILSLLGAIGASLVAGIRHQGLLLPVLIMPLYIPVLIFGCGAVIAANMNLAVNAYFAILGALVLLSLSFAPLLTSLALRMGVNQ